MNKPERSAFTPLDFREWNETGKLELQPKFQRREVWTTPKKSYLIDSLLQGMPVPPIFIRVNQSVDRTKIVREVVDGQQRIRAVLDFINGEYSLSRSFAKTHKAAAFAKMTQLQQDAILQYSFICESFHGISDAEVLEIFARVNTYSVPLNQQELLNGKYFGFFKSLAYGLAREHLEFWRLNQVFSETAISRMSEVELTSELLCVLIDGIQHKKDLLEKFYSDYDDSFPTSDAIAKQFRGTIDAIGEIIGSELSKTEFHRPAFFYTLFAAVSHRLYGIPKVLVKPSKSSAISVAEKTKARDSLLSLSDGISAIKDGKTPSIYSSDFVNACLRSTDKIQERRIRFATVYKMAFG